MGNDKIIMNPHILINPHKILINNDEIWVMIKYRKHVECVHIAHPCPSHRPEHLL